MSIISNKLQHITIIFNQFDIQDRNQILKNKFFSKKRMKNILKSFGVAREGIEPATFALLARRSNQLS